MGIKVTYKGNIITSFNNDSSKILNTAGKFLEDDILIEPTLIATLGTQAAHRRYFEYNNTSYSATNSTFAFSPGDSLSIEVYGEMAGATIYENGTQIGTCDMDNPYTYTLPNYNITITTAGVGGASCYIVPSDPPNTQPLSVTVNGTYTAPSGIDGYSPITVNVPGGGVTTTEESNSTGTTLYINSTGSGDDVRFIDYDGTVLYSYSATEFANLSAMPANPSHSGLTAQGWNWTLADAKAQVAAMGTCDIGQMYVTDDGKTRVYISLIDSTRLSPYLGICPNGTVVVNWGDGTATATLTGTSLTTVQRAQHTYATIGDYVITLTASSGTFAIYGSNTSSNGTYLLTRTNGDIKSQRCYQNTIKKVELGANVSLGDYAFYYCHSLTSITIPSGVTSIGNYAFYYCYSLANITIPSSVTTIGSNAFCCCYSLVSTTIPSNITSLSEVTFDNCVSLARITIPSSVTSIGNYAFRNCYSLTSITIPSGVTSIGKNAFSYCYSIESITIPSSVTSIGTFAFASCYSLANITIPSSVTSIGEGTLQDCPSLASITIPSGVTSIGPYAFYYCDFLASITIPSGVTSIGNYAFGGCYGVAEYHLLPTTPPTLSKTNAFTNILDDCKIYVPSGSLTAYQTATNWSTYASYMVGE